MATTTTAAHARIVATFRKDKGSASSELALLDDARAIGHDVMFQITTADRQGDIPKSVKGKDLEAAKKKAEKTARDWSRQVWTAVLIFDLVVDGRASQDDRKTAATAILKRTRRGSNDVAAKGCKITGSGDDLVSAVEEAIKGKNGKATKEGKKNALDDMRKVSAKPQPPASEQNDGPLLKAARAKVTAMDAALREGDSGNLEKAQKIADQIEEAAAFLEAKRAHVLEILARESQAVQAAAQAAAQADMLEDEEAA